MHWPAFAPAADVDDATLRILALAPTTVLADAMDRSGILDGAIRHVGGPARLAGRAFTVLAFPGDNLTVSQALGAAPPGAVLVVSAGGADARGFALVGEFVAAEAARRGLAGFVVDGMVRDVEQLRAGPVAVFARGPCARGPAKGTQGRLGWPVAAGGVAVLTGDVVVADPDGVAVVPAAVAPVVAASVAEHLRVEVQTRRRLGAGEALDAIQAFPPYPYPLATAPGSARPRAAR